MNPPGKNSTCQMILSALYFGHARRKHDGANQLALRLFRRNSEPDCVSTSASNPGNFNRLPGCFLSVLHSYSHSHRLHRRPCNPRLIESADYQAGCRVSGHPRDEIGLAPVRTSNLLGNGNTNGLTVTSGKAVAHPRHGRCPGVKTRCPSRDRY